MTEQTLSVIDNLRIFQAHGRAVVLDSDLAAIYGVTTGIFDQAIKRNLARFQHEFSFVITENAFMSLMSQIVISKGRGGRRKSPRVFTEHGAIMAATILNSPRPVTMSVCVVRAFVRLRRELFAKTTLAKRLPAIAAMESAADVRGKQP